MSRKSQGGLLSAIMFLAWVLLVYQYFSGPCLAPLVDAPEVCDSPRKEIVFALLSIFDLYLPVQYLIKKSSKHHFK